LISQRVNSATSFPSWQLSNLGNPIWSEGAPQINSNTTADLFVYASNNVPPSYKTDIILLQNVGLNPSTQGNPLPSNVNDVNSREDNPHIERIDAQNLVLFFDSDDKPGGVGLLDIWYTTSSDNGINWVNPIQVSSLNTTDEEQQPHLYNDGTDWYIYYTGTNTTTGKTEIYRAKQNTIGNWDSWTNIESIIGVGNAFAVGEPTLTEYGDISFVVIYEDPIDGTSTDKYDADPWLLPKIGSPLSLSELGFENSVIKTFPNPATNTITFETPLNFNNVSIYNSLGILIKTVNLMESKTINIESLKSGIYFLKLGSQNKYFGKFIKE
jgi:hypothetical protein